MKPISHPKSLSKIAYSTLLKSILDGQLKPGHLYNEIAIAKELNISRTPVREALLELSTKGLVSYLPRKGVQIKKFTKQDVEEIFDLRMAIESFAVQKIVESSFSDFKRFEKILNDQKRAVINKDDQAFMEADRTFHTSFSKLANNKRLLSILENLRDLIHLMGIQALDLENRAEVVIEEHVKIVEAVRSRNAEKARGDDLSSQSQQECGRVEQSLQSMTNGHDVTLHVICSIPVSQQSLVHCAEERII